MEAFGQSVINKPKKITTEIELAATVRQYFFLLLLTVGRKNYTSMAREADKTYEEVFVPKDTLVEKIEYVEKQQIKAINDSSTEENVGKLVIDFTMLIKQYSELIEKTTYDWEGCNASVKKGVVVGVAAWTNGKITIPLTLRPWLRLKDAGDAYKKKSDITQTIILEAKKVIKFNEVLLDGAFVSVTMLIFYSSENISFTARIPRNRKITTADGVCDQLQNHPAFKLKKNEKYRTVEATIKGMPFYFTTEKRRGKNNTTEVVFIVSNVKSTPKKTVTRYAMRSRIECFFRTAKQLLGANDCQSTSWNKQRYHIAVIMYAYACLQRARYDKKIKNVEAIVHVLRRQKTSLLANEYIDLIETFMKP